ncbi:secretin N-terminal domain-containing protein [Halopseudomonas pelagia]|uniref:secretin N-terminal domain-containing protein n=1 Tax=Halopseudomonas pelagia TaxID=553151 RepID=UPI0003A23F74|nr:secretin N-terminal domain-containing protein [Halopseudomonas pelagia]
MNRPWLAKLLLLLVLGYGGSAQAAPTTEIFHLGYGMAENMIPAIEPMLRDDERVSAYGSQLIVRAEPERLEEIRALLAELDRQPAQLRISVASSGEVLSSERGYQVDGRLKTDPADIVIGDPRNGNQARVIQRSTRGQNDGMRQITANEGYPVLIQTGQSVPLQSYTTDVYGRVIEGTQYRDVTQGFYATVRLNGDLATITLSANHDSVNRNDSRVIDVQQTDTVVTARLGEWITVGGIGDSARSSGTDIGRSTSTRSQNDSSIRLKVERAN